MYIKYDFCGCFLQQYVDKSNTKCSFLLRSFSIVFFMICHLKDIRFPFAVCNIDPSKEKSFGYKVYVDITKSFVRNCILSIYTLLYI